jgi:hypothetical protein
VMQGCGFQRDGGVNSRGFPAGMKGAMAMGTCLVAIVAANGLDRGPGKGGIVPKAHKLLAGFIPYAHQGHGGCMNHRIPVGSNLKRDLALQACGRWDRAKNEVGCDAGRARLLR